MEYWLHRITGGDNAFPLASALFKRESDPYISIGWSDFSNEEFLDSFRSGDDEFNKVFMDRWKYYPKNRFNLWRFVNSMRQGDYVVVPLPYEFTVCEILDNEVITNESIDESLLVDWQGKPLKKVKNEDGVYVIQNSDGKKVDLGFYRRVKIIQAKIPRRGYADQKLYSRMKIRLTNSHITDIKESVETAITRYREGQPIELRTSILKDTRVQVLDLVRKLYNETSFEELVGNYLKAIGADYVWKPNPSGTPTEAGDADRIGHFDKLRVDVMVQAKKHNAKTDAWAIEQIKAYKQNHPTDGTTILWVVSTCDDFSEEAKKMAAEENVRLINGLDFVDMLLDAGLENIA